MIEGGWVTFSDGGVGGDGGWGCDKDCGDGGECCDDGVSGKRVNRGSSGDVTVVAVALVLCTNTG